MAIYGVLCCEKWFVNIIRSLSPVVIILLKLWHWCALRAGIG